MLLDTHAVRTTMTHILPADPPPPLFVKRVTAAFAKMEPLLKTLQIRPSPPEALIQAYLIHIADMSDANFRKILDLKGIRTRSEQTALIELFQMHKLSERYRSSLVDKSPLLTPLVVSSGAPSSSSSGTPGAAVTLQNLSALGNSAAASISNANLPANMRFDPSGLGTALMDRFASGTGTPRADAGIFSPSLDGGFIPNNPGGPSSANSNGGAVRGSNPTTSAVTAAGEAGTRLNENLRNIGRFFRRDLGGLGTRFGGGSSGGGNNGAGSPAPPEER